MIFMIDNYDSFTYNLVQHFYMLGCDVTVRRNDQTSIDEIAALNPAAMVISPGPGNPDTAGVSLQAVRFFAGKLPILGVCLGHQSIGQAFGGRIVHAKRLMHGKTSPVRHDCQGLFEGVPQNFTAMRYHSLALEEETLPPCLTVTARSDDGEIMGIRHNQLPIEGIQYHPESIMTPTGRQQLSNFLRLACEFNQQKRSA